MTPTCPPSRPLLAKLARTLVSAVLPAALLVSVGSVASAQPGGFGGPGQQPMMSGNEDETKPEGVAEKAPEDKTRLPTVPTLPPWPGQAKKQFRLIELDGYLRTRSSWYRKFDLGFQDEGSGSSFPEALSCQNDASAEVEGSCGGSVAFADMRLRVSPTINLTEQIAVKVDLDVFDNMVMGSNPKNSGVDGSPRPSSTPYTGASDGQGFTSDAIRVKRAWAEVQTAIGLFKFGRMPTHWGLGVNENAGYIDPFHDNAMCLDCDFGDQVDRMYFSRGIPGTDLTGGIARDFGAAGLTSDTTGQYPFRGQGFDLENADDMVQWVFILARQDDPATWRKRLDAGETAINWGLYATRRTYDRDLVASTEENPLSPAGRLVPREGNLWIPDVWLRLGSGKLNFELEGVLQVGSVEDLGDVSSPLAGVDQSVFGYGGVARLDVLLSDDELKLGLEVGHASGDQWEGDKPAQTHWADKPHLPVESDGLVCTTGRCDDTISNFFFDPDFHVDLILFRRLIGTVTNATYFKPNLAYDISDRFRLKVATVISFANVPVSTPGNGTMYGVELDGDLGYHNDDEGFFAGVQYGVLFPMGALDHPGSIFPNDNESGDASTAQTFQFRFAVKF